MRHLSLTVIEGLYAICKLDKDAAIPSWSTIGHFLSITRSSDELSIVCPQAVVPDGIVCESDWRCLRVVGAMPFTAVGVLASLVTPLAEAGISVFAISTFDTDYLLVKGRVFEKAIDVLRGAGHLVEET